MSKQLDKFFKKATKAIDEFGELIAKARQETQNQSGKFKSQINQDGKNVGENVEECLEILSNFFRVGVEAGKSMEENLKNNINTINFKVAVSKGDADTVSKLIPHVDINTVDTKGKTPIMIASINGFDKVVKILSDAGAVINAHDYKGNTALHYATIKGYAGVVKVLLSNESILPNSLDKHGKTALDIAKFHNDEALVKLLTPFVNDINNSEVIIDNSAQPTEVVNSASHVENSMEFPMELTQPFPVQNDATHI